jgi:hypothetical protein
MVCSLPLWERIEERGKTKRIKNLFVLHPFSSHAKGIVREGFRMSPNPLKNGLAVPLCCIIMTQ